uniref:Uncharacterized protein n=1 Tax=Timema cristinae TaxID=61476 RepID=A0A7R9GZR6_TIMCR|nr:unnamed protein product [Timema cristinae]
MSSCSVCRSGIAVTLGTGSHHSRPSSSREQLTGATLVVVPSPQPGCPRSIFGRLGIRKPSLLSLTSPQGHGSLPANTTARTFSLDDLLGPPPRRTPSPRKKRNNSTPTKDNFAEKSHILHQLITPSANRQPSRKSSLGELIHLAERKINEAEKYKEGGECETTFIGSPPLFDLHSPVILDSKLEKKVTFARLLSKVSAEMSSGSEVEHVNKHPSLLNRSNSTPPSPAADPKSPHSTSSNQGSDSMSSIDVTLTSTNARLSESFANRSSNHLLHGGLSLKNHSADSILAMFRNFSSAPIASNQKPSTSTTPTTSSPQDDVAGSDESSTSSCSFTMDSPPFLPTFHRHTIQVPVLDAMSAHKDTGEGSNLLHPPTILLEIPRLGTSKCLSPIREVPTPSLSPALTPILPRSHTYQDEEKKLDESTIETNKSDAKDIKSLPFSPAFCFKRELELADWLRGCLHQKKGEYVVGQREQ